MGPTFILLVGDEPNIEGYVYVYIHSPKSLILMYFYGIIVTRCVSVMVRSLHLCSFNTASSKKAEMYFFDLKSVEPCSSLAEQRVGYSVSHLALRNNHWCSKCWHLVAPLGILGPC